MLKQTIWQWLIFALQQHKTAALLVVVDSKGSSPGKSAAKMAITSDKATFGTIGGGKVEYDLTRYALQSLQKNIQNTEQTIQLFYKQHYNSKTSDASGQICGGTQIVALLIFQQSDLPLLKKIQQAQETAQASLLIITEQGFSLSKPIKSHLIENQSLSSFTLHKKNEHQLTDWCYQEVIGLPKSAYIIGGGHVSLALTQILVMLDFDVTIIDERAAVKTMEDNTLARYKYVAPYSEIDKKIIESLHTYVFVMTHSHETDQQVVELLAAKNFKYFGVLGSRHKISLMMKNLEGKISQQTWQSIHAPIGLAIKSTTPIEIAISISAELIKFDNTSD